MENVVKYNNGFNSLNMSGFSALDLDALMMLCAQLKEKQTETLEFSFYEIKQTLHLEDQTDDKLISILKRMNRKLNLVNGHFETEDEIVDFVLFPTFRTLKKEKKLKVQVNESFAYLLNGLTKNFTRFELSEFIGLESKYSKNLYRILKQYRVTGGYKTGIGQLKEAMGCPTGYSVGEFTRTALSPAVKELEAYFEGLKVEPIKEHRRGAPIVGYEFTFKPQKKERPDQETKLPSAADRDGQEPPRTKKSTKKTKFSNFEERKYNWDELEDALTAPQANEG